MPLAYVTNIQSFCAAHRLNTEELSIEENKRIYGKCNNINSHGHNYRLETTVVGEIDPVLGYAINFRELKGCILEVIEPLDHKRIDMDIDYFKQKNMVATAENMAVYIWDELKKLLPSSVALHKVRLYETDKNYVDIKG